MIKIYNVMVSKHFITLVLRTLRSRTKVDVPFPQLVGERPNPWLLLIQVAISPVLNFEESFMDTVKQLGDRIMQLY